MNPFIYPEFWLSLSFLIIVGLLLLPPVRRSVGNFFKGYRQKIEVQISEANALYEEALQAHNEMLKELKVKQSDKNLSQEIKKIKQEFSEKKQAQIKLKKQDFEVRQNLTVSQIKNHLRSCLLDEVEGKILHLKTSPKTSEKDIKHFLKILHENEESLKKIV